MSGPKIVGITCDPKVIEKNNERLRIIGKERYYTGVLGNINIDIQNTGSWVENYGMKTLQAVPEEYDDSLGILGEITKLKEKYIEKIEMEKINLKVIQSSTPEQLNKLGIKKVEAIPIWKDQFIKEVSVLLKKLQLDVEEFNSGIRQSQAANDKLLREKREQSEKIRKVAHELDGLEVGTFYMKRYNGDTKNIPFMPKYETIVDPETLPFSLDELALIEMLQLDLEEFTKLDYIGKLEKEVIRGMKQDLGYLCENGVKAYSMKSKRAILSRMRLEYVRLEMYISKSIAARNAEMEERNTLEMEYTSFCQALDIRYEDYRIWTIPKLKERVEELKQKVEKQEERIYIEETIDEIMEQYGYSSITSYHLHDADSVSRIIFEDKKGGKISTSFGDGMIMMNVIGEGDSPPTDDEVNEQVRQQEAFCNLYPRIREQLKEKGISISYENLMPVSDEQTSNEKIIRQKDINKSTKKFSFRHVRLVSRDVDKEPRQSTYSRPNVQYVDMED